MSKPSLLYVYDALCGWCYGFSSTITHFYQAHKEQLNFEVVSGGMVVGEREGPIGQVAGYISQAYKDVEVRTGVTFGQGFLQGILKPGTAMFTSVPPAISMSVFKTMQPSQQLPFATALQKAIYFDGIAPNDVEAYGPVAAQFGLDAADFTALMQEPSFAQKARQDFAFAQQLQVNGFPTVFLVVGKQAYMLARGYVPLEVLEQNFAQAMAKVGA